MQFVVLSDHFDESMVILKRIFCWSDEEVMYVRLNTRPHVSYKDLPESLVKSIADYSKGDQLLFEVANKTLWKIIDNIPDFQGELRGYKQKLLTYRKLCETRNYQSYECLSRENSLVKVRSDIAYASKASIVRKLKEVVNEFRSIM